MKIAVFLHLCASVAILPTSPLDCVISRATIHCFNDTSYGNSAADIGWQKPYQAAAKLRDIAVRTVPGFVSVSVNEDEGFFDNNVHPGHENVRSFTRVAFILRDYVFDYVCGGAALKSSRHGNG